VTVAGQGSADSSSEESAAALEELSALIGKTANTIRTCATNAKYQHLIPRPFKLPHSRRLAWYEEDVLAWLSKAQPVGPEPMRRRRGRPTKLEQIARARVAGG
jgi:predicted DNA-binding transcriptional regulator AlpA